MPTKKKNKIGRPSTVKGRKTISLGVSSDEYAHLKKQENLSDYIRSLIKKDMGVNE